MNILYYLRVVSIVNVSRRVSVCVLGICFALALVVAHSEKNYTCGH